MIDSCCVLNKFFLRLNFPWVTYITSTTRYVFVLGGVNLDVGISKYPRGKQKFPT